MKNGHMKKCITCQKDMYITPCSSWRKNCSTECSAKWRKGGSKWTLRNRKLEWECKGCGETFLAYSRKDGAPRINCSLECRNKTYIGKPSWNKGKKHPERSGKNHHAWIIDRSQLKKSSKKHLSVQYKYWMLAVKKRDNWLCRIADNNCNGGLEAHHILRWSKHPELRYEVNNGITLCHFHHPRKINDEMKLVPSFRELVKQAN